jgi:hypothetical protein
LAALMWLPACDGGDKPWLEIEGGGFIFNYRIAEVFYGVSVRPMRRLAEGTIIEAEFENPSGGPPFVVRETVAGRRLAYSLRSPPLDGVRKDQPYRVVVRVRESGTERELARLEQSFKSDLDQSILPERPLTVGPGHAPNPELRQTP